MPRPREGQSYLRLFGGEMVIHLARAGTHDFERNKVMFQLARYRAGFPHEAIELLA